MLDEDSDRSKMWYTMKFRWLFGIWTFSLVVWHLNIFVHSLTFEQVLALSLQEWCWRILHYWISSARISVLGTTVRLWAAGCVQMFFSCSPGILNIRTVGTAGMHNFNLSFKSSGISSPSDLVLFPDHHLLISFATSVLAEFGRGNRTTARCSRARVCADVRMCARARARGSACVTVCRRCPTGG